jgi:hypothetical protein
LQKILQIQSSTHQIQIRCTKINYSSGHGALTSTSQNIATNSCRRLTSNTVHTDCLAQGVSRENKGNQPVHDAREPGRASEHTRATGHQIRGRYERIHTWGPRIHTAAIGLRKEEFEAYRRIRELIRHGGRLICANTRLWIRRLV